MMRPLTAIAAVLVVAGPWFAAVAWRTGGAFLYEFFGVQNFGRFVGAMDNHSGAIWYYLPAILVGFFPWSIFAVPTLLDLIRRCRGLLPGSDGAKFLCSWILVYLGFFSIAATKLPNYVLPAYPALAWRRPVFSNVGSRSPRAFRGGGRGWRSAALTIGVGATIAPVVLFSGNGGQNRVQQLGIAQELKGDLLRIAWLGAILLAAGCAGLTLSILPGPNRQLRH